MRLAVVGTGYVGLVTAACFAESGNHVICMDIDESKIERLKRGEVPFYEPGLDELVAQNLEEERLNFTTDLDAAVKDSSIIFIAVGTPPQPDGSADLSAVFQVAEAIAKAMNSFKTIVMKSTVPVGTTEQVHQIISANSDYDFQIACNPEFLKEGDAVNDFMKPDRVVIGTDDPHAADVLKELHAPFVRTENPIIVMDIRSAEMTKYVANAMLATRISFMNEVANICERLGVDVEMVRKGIGADRRIGYAFIFPGVGYGGSCFPKDVKALLSISKECGYHPRVLEAIDSVNQEQRRIFYEKIHGHFRDLKGRKIAIWGLSFKPKTDDMREAPSITVIGSLLADGARICAHDPKANGQAKAIFKNAVQFCDNCYEALEGAEALVLLTEWSEFRNPDFRLMKQKMKSPVIFDGRNLYDPQKLRAMGFTYYGVGRPSLGFRS